MNSDRDLFELATKVFIGSFVKTRFNTDPCSKHLPISHTDQQPCNKLLCKHKEIIPRNFLLYLVSSFYQLVC